MASMTSARGSMGLSTSGATVQRYLTTSVSLPLLMARYVPCMGATVQRYLITSVSLPLLMARYVLCMAVCNRHTSSLHPMVFPFACCTADSCKSHDHVVLIVFYSRKRKSSSTFEHLSVYSDE